MRSAGIQVVSAGAMTGTITSLPVLADQDCLVSFQAVYTGSPVGSLSIQCSNDQGLDNAGTGVVNWSSYPSSTHAVAAAGDFPWEIPNTAFRWFRLVYTFTSGTGTLNARAYVKGA